MAGEEVPVADAEPAVEADSEPVPAADADAEPAAEEADAEANAEVEAEAEAEAEEEAEEHAAEVAAVTVKMERTASKSHNVAEEDEQPVIDWSSEPDQQIADTYAQLYRPSCRKVGAATESGRAVVDRAHCEVDAKGWMVGEGVEKYPLFSTTDNDLAAIGGVGMRQYYLILKSLAALFLFCGCVVRTHWRNPHHSLSSGHRL